MYLNETPIKDILEERYQLPVSVDNDGKCAAQAEAWKGNLSDVNSSIVIIIGTGIGGGISAQDSLIEATRECIKEYFTTTGSRYAVREPLIDRCRFKNEAKLIGALKHFLSQHNI